MVDGIECGGLPPGSHDSGGLVGESPTRVSAPRGWVFGLSSASFIGMAGWGLVWSAYELDPDG